MELMQPRFCYRVAADAGLSYDKEGKPSSTLVQIEFQGGGPIHGEMYHEYHEIFRHTLAEQLELPEASIEAISIETYDEENEE